MRRKGPIGTIMGFITTCIIIGIIVAMLRHFNGDIGALISWLFATIYNFIMSIADAVTNLRIFG